MLPNVSLSFPHPIYFFRYSRIHLNMRFLTAALLLWSSWAAAAEEETKTPPPFFLIDTTDQLCLSGEEFKRCSIDTLFYVVGAPGKSVSQLVSSICTAVLVVVLGGGVVLRIINISSHPILACQTLPTKHNRKLPNSQTFP
jgi:hypothetical protein